MIYLTGITYVQSVCTVGKPFHSVNMELFLWPNKILHVMLLSIIKSAVPPVFSREQLLLLLLLQLTVTTQLSRNKSTAELSAQK